MTDVVIAEVDTGQVAKRGPVRPVGDGVDDQLVAQVVEQARAAGLRLTGEGGLLQQLTKRVLEAALDGGITDHLGYDKGDPAGNNGGNSGNGMRGKTVLTEVGPVRIEVPRDRDGSFEPQIVRKRQRRFSGVDGDLLVGQGIDDRGDPGTPVRGLRRRRVVADDLHDHRQGRRGYDRVADRLLDPVYPVIFLDAVHVKIRALSPIL